MKMKVKIEDISHDDLVNLFSTALYANDLWYCDYDYDWLKQHCTIEAGDCIEDKFAKVLLAGGSLEISDREAGEFVFYGDLPHKWDEENDCMVYTVTLDDIRKGLEKACNDYNMTVQVYDLMNDPAEIDMYDASNLLQVIVFGECIYG